MLLEAGHLAKSVSVVTLPQQKSIAIASLSAFPILGFSSQAVPEITKEIGKIGEDLSTDSIWRTNSRDLPCFSSEMPSSGRTKRHEKRRGTELLQCLGPLQILS